MVRKARKHLAPYLKDLAGPWICAFFDPSKEVVRFSTEAWNEALNSPKKRTDALEFVQQAALGHIMTNLLEHTPETLSDARFVTQVEMEERYTRVVVSSLKALGFLVKELGSEQRNKCAEDYGKIFGASKFWALATLPATAPVRRTAFDLISTLTTNWKEAILERIDSVLPTFPSKAFTDQDPTVHGEMWQAVLLFTKTFPDGWAAASLVSSKGKDRSLPARLFSFLGKGCFGSANVSYPSLLPLLSFLPASVATYSFFTEFFHALWAGIGSSNVDRTGASALVSAYSECLLLVAGKLTAKDDGEEAAQFRAKTLEKYIQRLSDGLLDSSKSLDIADKVVADVWIEAVSKVLSRIASAKQDIPGLNTIWSFLLVAIERAIFTDKESAAPYDEPCARVASILRAASGTTSGSGDENESMARNGLRDLIVTVLERSLDRIATAPELQIGPLARLAADLLPLIEEQALEKMSGFFSGPLQAILSSEKVPLASLKPFMEAVCTNDSLLGAHFAGILAAALAMTGLRRLEVVAVLLESSFIRRDQILLCGGIPSSALDEYVEHLVVQRLGKVPLSEFSEGLIGVVVSHSLAGGYLSQASVDRLCSFLAGWLSEFVTSFLTFAGPNGHSIGSFALHTAESVLGLVAFVLDVRSEADWFPHSIVETFGLDMSDLASFSPVNADLQNFVVLNKDGTADMNGEATCLRVQSLARQIAQPYTELLFRESASEHAAEMVSRWWANYNNLQFCGTPGQLAAQLSQAFDVPRFPFAVKSAWLEEALFNEGDSNCSTSDVSDSVWLKLGDEVVTRAFFPSAIEPADLDNVTDIHGLRPLARRTGMLVEMAREMGVSELLELERSPSASNGDSPAGRLLLDLLDFRIAAGDAKSGLMDQLRSEEARVLEDVDSIIEALLDQGGEPKPGSAPSLVAASSTDLEDDIISASFKITLREACSAQGKSQIRVCRRFLKLLQIVQERSLVTGAEAWTLFEAIDKAHRVGNLPFGALVAAIVALVPSAAKETRAAFQSQLMSRLGSLDPKTAIVKTRQEAWKLLVAINASFATTTGGDSALPTPRIVFLLRQIMQWFSSVELDMDSDFIVLCSELAGLLNNLAPLVVEADGAHWQFMVSQSVQWLKMAEPLPAVWMLHHRTYGLVQTLLDLAIESAAVADAVQNGHKQLYAELLNSYLADWKQATGPAGTNRFEEASRSLVAELCQHVPHDVLVPAGRFSDLVAMLRSGVEWDQKAAAILLNRETIERIQGLSLRIEMGAGSSGGGDDEEGPKHTLPAALVELASERPVIDLDVLFGEDEGMKLTDGLRYLLAWYAIMAHFGDITFQLKAAYVRHIRDTDHLLSDLLDYLFDVLGVGQPGLSFDLALWDLADFDVSAFDPSSTVSYRLLTAHILWLVMRNMPTLVRLWFSGIKDKQYANAIESYVQKHFTPKLISIEMDSVRKADPARFENMDFRSRGTSEVIVEYNVEDTASLELLIRFPGSYPLKPVEIEGTGSRAGVSDAKWKAWILNITAVMMTQNGKVYDAVAVWHRNVTLHYQGVEECAICYSIVGVIDRTLPSRTCKTCKHKFHNGCMSKWLKTSGQNLWWAKLGCEWRIMTLTFILVQPSLPQRTVIATRDL